MADEAKKLLLKDMTAEQKIAALHALDAATAAVGAIAATLGSDDTVTAAHMANALSAIAQGRELYV
jgi:hypothetical protein